MSNDVFEYQFRLAWEHFKFHAEQRTRVFHFFLITVALLLNAFSWMLRSTDPIYQGWAFLLLCIGGILSTIFLGLDVRNTQLLEQSEALLRRMEEDDLYKDDKWVEVRDGKKLRLGILSREATLKKHMKENHKSLYSRLFRWITFDNIKHKFGIRFIQFLAIICFWVGAYKMTNEFKILPLFILFGPEIKIKSWEIGGLILCLIWGFHAVATPGRHLGWELEALKDPEENVGADKPAPQ